MVIPRPQSPLMNTISSLKESAIACAPLRDEQVEVVRNLLRAMMVREFFKLATGKASLFFFFLSSTYFGLTICSESSIVTVEAHF